MSKTSLTQFDQFSEDDLSQISGRLLYIRKNLLQLTQKEFSKELGISQSFLSQIESGNRIITADIAMKVSSVYGVSLAYLLYGDGSGDTSDSSIAFEKNYNQVDSLKKLEAAYNLNKNDIDIIKWFCSLDEDRRTALCESIQVLLTTE